MDKDLCFLLGNKKIYLEQVLVDYMGVPIFFLCKNKNQFYVSLCTDIDELNYIVAEVSLVDVYSLLHGKIPMRNIFLNLKEYWEITSGEEIDLDTVIKCDRNHLDVSLLPEAGACFAVLTKEMEGYIRRFDNDFLNEKNFVENEERMDLDEILKKPIFNETYGGLNASISWDGYSFQSKLKQQSAGTISLNGEYVPRVHKSVVLQRSCKSEKWRNDDTINVAA